MALEFGFRERILLSVAAACAVCAGGAAWVSTKQVEEVGMHDLELKSEAILSRLESARSYIATQGMVQSVMAEAVAQYPDGNLTPDMKMRVLRTVPIFAAMQIGQDQAEENQYRFRIASENPRNEENAPTAEERKFLARFESEPDLEQITWENEEADELWVMRPIRLSEQDGCLLCHGHPSASPWKNGKDILGYPMENWTDGKMHGMFAIHSKLAPTRAVANAVAWRIVKWSFLLLTLAVGASAILVGRPLGKFVALVRGASTQLLEISEELTTSSAVVRQSSDTLAAGAARQAASLEETSAAVTELAASAEENASSSERAHTAALQAKGEAEASSDDARKMRQFLGTMREASNEMAEIIRTIESVAFQTKLLALNAGVEAARAGDAGRGFAVVAEEVGTLAQKTAEAASKTDERIRRSIDMVQKGAGSADQVSEGLGRIQAKVEDATALVHHIATASSEQSRTTAQVRSALNQIDQVTQQNAASAEEASSAANLLSEQAVGIQDQIESLQKLVGTGSATRASSSGTSRSFVRGSGDGDSRGTGVLAKLKIWNRAA